MSKLLEGGQLPEAKHSEGILVERSPFESAGDDRPRKPPAHPERLSVVEVPTRTTAAFRYDFEHPVKLATVGRLKFIPREISSVVNPTEYDQC